MIAGSIGLKTSTGDMVEVGPGLFILWDRPAHSVRFTRKLNASDGLFLVRDESRQLETVDDKSYAPFLKSKADFLNFCAIIAALHHCHVKVNEHAYCFFACELV